MQKRKEKKGGSFDGFRRKNYNLEFPAFGHRDTKNTEEDDTFPWDDFEMEDLENIDKDQKSEELHGRDSTMAKRNFTLKRLVRLLHIDKPVYHVMAILGKRYDFFVFV